MFKLQSTATVASCRNLKVRLEGKLRRKTLLSSTHNRDSLPILDQTIFASNYISYYNSQLKFIVSCTSRIRYTGRPNADMFQRKELSYDYELLLRMSLHSVSLIEQ